MEEPGQSQNMRMEIEEAKFAFTWEVRKTALERDALGLLTKEDFPLCSSSLC